MGHRIARDFIFLDADRLYSLYSQIFEGLPTATFDLSYGSVHDTDSQKGRFMAGQSHQQAVTEGVQKLEEKTLHDYMYNKLEAELSDSIVDGNTLNLDSSRELLQSSPLIKISGSAEIEDYARLSEFAGFFNQLAEVIAAASLQSEGDELAKKIDRSIENITDPNERSRAKAGAKKKLKPKEVAKLLNLSQDEELLRGIQFMVEKFAFSEGVEISVAPLPANTQLTFRGVVDRTWLRLSVDMLRSMYGGFAECNWTMVGHILTCPRFMYQPK